MVIVEWVVSCKITARIPALQAVVRSSEESENEVDDWHLIYVAGDVGDGNCVCRCLHDLDLAVYDTTKVDFRISPKKLLLRQRWRPK